MMRGKGIMRNSSFAPALLIAALPVVAAAQATFKYGDDIAGELKIVGPVYFTEGADVGAMVVFEMEGPFPDVEETYLARSTEVACNVMRQQILSMAEKVKDEDYTVIAIQFRWPWLDAAGLRTTRNWTGVYKSEDCAPLK